jgi:hypothetical protein
MGPRAKEQRADLRPVTTTCLESDLFIRLLAQGRIAGLA